jgi:hypothetical protein
VPKFEAHSRIEGDQKLVARELLTMEGVNHELHPIVKMTASSEWAKKPLTEWPVNIALFTSTILLFGLVPVDAHTFRLRDVHSNGFQESSSSLVNNEWNHRRTISNQPSGCLVHDVVEYLPKVSILGQMMKPIYKAIFNHRHKRLKRKYGAKR